MNKIAATLMICGLAHWAFSQNFGVDQSNPQEKLHVNGDLRVSTGEINSDGDHLQFMSGVRSDDNAYEWIGFYSGSTRQGIILYDGSWGGANSLTNEFSLTAENNNLLTLNTSNNHIALMPKNGNVGIGTTSPGYKLDVNGTVGLGQTNLENSDIYFTNTSHNHTGLGNTTGHAAIENAANYNTLMILGRAGGIGGGRSVSIWDRLDVNGSAYTTNGNWSGSDERWKQNIHTLTGALAIVKSLRGVRYSWKEDTQQYKTGRKGPDIGLIAQEVKTVVPEAVSKMDEQGHLAVSYEKMVPVLIEAVKEQQKTIESLEQRIKALEAK